jgi:methylphosphotriester-DNA--protein-cysteine methyltransferase
MIGHADLTASELRGRIDRDEIRFAGHLHLKIYGLLQCGSGKRMNRENRVFFSSETEAIAAGFRPCGNCMRNSYKAWRNAVIQP